MRGEVAGPEQPVFLGGDREEHDRPPQMDARLVQPARDVEERRRPGRVVHRPVVNAVAVDRFAAPEVIEVRAEHEVLARQLRVRSGRMPTTLSDSSAAEDVISVPRSCPARGKRGRGLRSCASASMSAAV